MVRSWLQFTSNHAHLIPSSTLIVARIFSVTVLNIKAFLSLYTTVKIPINLHIESYRVDSSFGL